jgi:signal transduction histidine kinase
MRRHIVLLVVGMTTLVVLAFAIPLAILIRDNAYQNGVKDLEDEGRSIGLYLSSGTSAPTAADVTAELAKQDSDRTASVRLPSGQLLGRRPPGGELPQPSGDGGPPGGDRDDPHGHGGPQPNTIAWHGGRLTQLVVPSPYGPYLVSVWAGDDALYAGDTGDLLLLGGVAIVLLAVGVLAAEVLTRRIVRPLVDTASTATRITAGDITARAPTDGPREVAEVGAALNRLADRIDQLIAEERETVADLSHRLRTPLTALRLDAESLRDPADAERVGAHVGTLERMLTAVIRAARRPQREGRMPACDATDVVRERVAFWSALTDEQERRSSITLPDRPVIVRAAAEDLAAAVDALLENVVAHTPEGTAFAVRLTPTDDGARLEVADDGPGLPVGEPVRGYSDRGSSGLGLDIARRCAVATGGSLTLGRAPSGGALITLELRAP